MGGPTPFQPYTKDTYDKGEPKNDEIKSIASGMSAMRRLVRIAAVMCVMLLLWTTPRGTSGLQDDDDHTELSCGQHDGEECQSLGVCIDIWRIIKICSLWYQYYEEEEN